MLENEMNENQQELIEGRISQLEIYTLVIWMLVVILVITSLASYCRVKKLESEINSLKEENTVTFGEELERNRESQSSVNIYIYGSQEDIEIENVETNEDPEEIREGRTITDLSGYTSLGEFDLTAYCPCSQCCGAYASGTTASGTVATAGRTVAADTSILPFGTHIVINGHEYIVEDRGSAVNGNHIDIFYATHEEALAMSCRRAEVYVKN